MCLATAGVILAIHELAPEGAEHAPAADPLWRCADVDFGGVQQQVSLACLPQAAVGDRVLVHVGLALSLVQDDDDHHPQAPAAHLDPAAAAPALSPLSPPSGP